MGIKLHKSVTLLIVFSIIVSLSEISSYADNISQPSVKFDSKFWVRTGTPGTTNNFRTEEELKGFSFDFEYFLGKKISDVNNIPYGNTFDLRDLKKKEKNIKNKYILNIFSEMVGGKKYGRSQNKGIYIFNTQNICIGHLFLTKGEKINHIINQPEFSTVKNMTVNSNYLGNKLVMPRSEITFYEKDHGDFIERYGMNNKYLYVQAFYPKELESFMQKRILNVLNFNYNSPKNAPINTTDEEFEATSRKMEDQDESEKDD